MDTLRTLSQILFLRLFTQAPGRARNQRGASALEYIVLAAIVVIVVATAGVALSPEISATFDKIVAALTTT